MRKKRQPISNPRVSPVSSSIKHRNTVAGRYARESSTVHVARDRDGWRYHEPKSNIVGEIRANHPTFTLRDRVRAALQDAGLVASLPNVSIPEKLTPAVRESLANRARSDRPMGDLISEE